MCIRDRPYIAITDVLHCNNTLLPSLFPLFPLYTLSRSSYNGKIMSVTVTVGLTESVRPTVTQSDSLVRTQKRGIPAPDLLEAKASLW